MAPTSASAIFDRGFLTTASDDELLTTARDGHVAAFAELYRRHHHDAHRYARRLTRRHLHDETADDIVAEAVRKMLTAIRRGRGPRTGFRPYLFTAIRTVTFNEALDPQRHRPSADEPEGTVAGADAGIGAGIAVQAWSRLPERWRRVLWATNVDDLSPAEVAILLGVSPNAVSALAMRAREALRVAYVREQLPRSPHRGCQTVLDLLARRAVVSIGRTSEAHLELHVGACESCQQAAQLVETEIGNSVRIVRRVPVPHTDGRRKGITGRHPMSIDRSAANADVAAVAGD